jgi:hypothetical protein
MSASKDECSNLLINSLTKNNSNNKNHSNSNPNIYSINKKFNTKNNPSPMKGKDDILDEEIEDNE